MTLADPAVPAELRTQRAAVAENFDRAADTYDQAVPFFTTFTADLVAWRPPPANADVLDLCTGDGRYLSALGATLEGGRLVGVDMSRGMVHKAATRLSGQRSGVRLIQSDAHRLPFAAAAFDACYCALSWHFLLQPDLVTAEPTRVTRPAATFVVSLLGRSENTWPFLGRTLAEYLPATPNPYVVARRRRKPTLDTLLPAHGWRIIAEEQVLRRLAFDSADQWIAWQRSQVGRAYFEQVSRDRLAELLDRLRDCAARAVQQTGLWVEQSVRFVQALRDPEAPAHRDPEVQGERA